MQAIYDLEQKFRKSVLPQIQSGDTVRVWQRIREGGKQRVQTFEGVVIRTNRPSELMATITVRRIASGVGVEKTFLMHSPHITKIEVIKRTKVRRNYLSYLRGRRGKSARLAEVSFDRQAVNVADEPEPKAAQADEEAKDAAVTELDQEEAADMKPEVPVEKVRQAEDQAAAAADPIKDPDANDDEALAPETEVESGLEKGQPPA